MLDGLLYLLVRMLVALLQALPLTAVARLGRAGGSLAWWLDARHRRVALANLERCFGREKSVEEIRALARENFRRLGENYASAIKTAAMSAEEIGEVLEVIGAEKLCPAGPGEPVPTRITAIGHFGNFELYARAKEFAPEGGPRGTTYRGLRQLRLDAFLGSLRARSGCQFFERRTGGDALKAALAKGGLSLGLLADQHSGKGGVLVPFFGQECLASAAPAVFSLRYRARLHVAVCYRVALGRWRIEIGEEIPTRVEGKARPVEEITRHINAALEIAVRRDPANWFWVHNRWRLPKN